MNELESEFYEQAIRYGYTVLKRGWPDFLIVKDGKAQGVEVKSPNDVVTNEQMTMMNTLANAGIDCWVYRSEWKGPEIVKRTKNDDIVDELFEYCMKKDERIKKEIMKLIESIPVPMYSYAISQKSKYSRGTRLEIRQEQFNHFVEIIENIKDIIDEPITKKSATLIQKWNRTRQLGGRIDD